MIVLLVFLVTYNIKQTQALTLGTGSFSEDFNGAFIGQNCTGIPSGGWNIWDGDNGGDACLQQESATARSGGSIKILPSEGPYGQNQPNGGMWTNIKDVTFGTTYKLEGYSKRANGNKSMDFVGFELCNASKCAPKVWMALSGGGNFTHFTKEYKADAVPFDQFLHLHVFIGASTISAAGGTKDTYFDDLSFSPVSGGGGVTPSPSPSSGQPSLTASPTTVIAFTGSCGDTNPSVCGTTSITFNTGDGSYGEVYVSDNGGTETLFITGTGSGTGTAPWILAGHTYVFKLYAGTTHTTVLGTPLTVTTSGGSTTSPSPSAATASTVSTSFYKVANNPTDLDSDTTTPWKTYTSDANGNMDIPYSFTDETPGQKFVWVQFKFSDETKSQKISKAINFVGADPNFSVSCTLDSGSGVIDFDMIGNNFGATKGTSKLTINNTDAQIDDWKNDKIKGHFTPSTTTKNYTVAINRSDGASTSQSCTLGLAQISVGTKLFCRSANTTDVSNVAIGLVEDRVGAKVAKETVVVGKDGVIKGLTSKLEEGKKYKMSIKAPKSLRKIVDFTAVSGTTGVANVNLAIGDISPPDGGDGIINNADRAELLRQWRLIPGSAAARSGDLNGDGLVNSFDWSCMVAGFSKPEEAELTSPVAVVASPSPSASPFPVVCAADVKQCPDGSFVLRDSANKCQFRACP